MLSQPSVRARPAPSPDGPPTGRRTIVCAVASVEEAERLVTVARELAERLMDELVLVHVVVPPPPGRGGRPPDDANEPLELEHLEQTGDSILRTIAEQLDLAAASRRPLVGDPAAAVVRVAEELDADLIVVASHRRGSLSSALLGSVSREIADATDRPVVVVPSTGPLHHLTSVRPIVCGADGSPGSRRAVRVANDLASRLHVGLVLTYAEQTPGRSDAPPLPSDDILREVAASEGLPPGTELQTRYGFAADVLADVAEEEDAGLIVVGRRGGLIKDLFRGSVSAAFHVHDDRVVVLA